MVINGITHEEVESGWYVDDKRTGNMKPDDVLKWFEVDKVFFKSKSTDIDSYKSIVDCKIPEKIIIEENGLSTTF